MILLCSNIMQIVNKSLSSLTCQRLVKNQQTLLLADKHIDQDDQINKKEIYNISSTMSSKHPHKIVIREKRLAE